MRAIRAWHMSVTYYKKLFQEISGLSSKEFSELSVFPAGSAFDCTNRLTLMREKLSALGYTDAVTETDRRFLDSHCGMCTQKAWEDFWEDYCKNHDVPPYPPDAL